MVSENINRLLIAFGNACLEMGKAYKPNNADELNAATQATTDTAGALRNAISRAETADARIAELEAESERFTAHGDIERQDDKWIPVSERLPEDLQSIIVFTKDRKTYIIRFLELYGREGFGSLSDIVTHWMPLPEPPEVKE